MAATVSVVSANLRQASSVRARSTYTLGVSPTSARNTRTKWRLLMAARRANSATVCLAPGSASMASCACRIASRVARGVQSGVSSRREAPAPQRYRTRQRATSWATSAPKSASTIASAVSIPPDVPAVHRAFDELRATNESKSPDVGGNTRAECSEPDRCVTSWRPAGVAASATRRVPAPIPTERRARLEAVRTQDIVVESDSAE